MWQTYSHINHEALDGSVRIVDMNPEVHAIQQLRFMVYYQTPQKLRVSLKSEALNEHIDRNKILANLARQEDTR